MIGAIRPFGIFPGVLVGKDGFETYQEWQTFIREIFQRAEKGGVIADFGLQSAISIRNGFLESNQVLKHLAKQNLLYRWPKQANAPNDSNSIFQSLVDGAETEPLHGIVSLEKNTTNKPPESTHPKKLSEIEISQENIKLAHNWWGELLQQEFVFEKTLENYKRILLPLAKIGGDIEIWDAYFNPKRNHYRHWVDLLSSLSKNSRSRIIINTSEKALEQENGQMEFQAAMEPLKRAISPKSNRLLVILRNQKQIPDGFHDRFIFTRTSVSIQLSWGTDQAAEHQQTCLILSPDTARRKRESLNNAPESSQLEKFYI